MRALCEGGTTSHPPKHSQPGTLPTAPTPLQPGPQGATETPWERSAP